jgi:hypothetical protein
LLQDERAKYNIQPWFVRGSEKVRQRVADLIWEHNQTTITEGIAKESTNPAPSATVGETLEAMRGLRRF